MIGGTFTGGSIIPATGSLLPVSRPQGGGLGGGVPDDDRVQNPTGLGLPYVGNGALAGYVLAPSATKGRVLPYGNLLFLPLPLIPTGDEFAIALGRGGGDMLYDPVKIAGPVAQRGKDQLAMNAFLDVDLAAMRDTMGWTAFSSPGFVQQGGRVQGAGFILSDDGTQLWPTTQPDGYADDNHTLPQRVIDAYRANHPYIDNARFKTPVPPELQDQFGGQVWCRVNRWTHLGCITSLAFNGWGTRAENLRRLLSEDRVVQLTLKAIAGALQIIVGAVSLLYGNAGGLILIGSGIATLADAWDFGKEARKFQKTFEEVSGMQAQKAAELAGKGSRNAAADGGGHGLGTAALVGGALILAKWLL